RTRQAAEEGRRGFGRTGQVVSEDDDLGGGGHSDSPAHWVMTWPVMLRASGPSRNATRPATSSAAMNRPMGGIFDGVRSRLGSASMGVSGGSGPANFTRAARHA